MFNGLKARRRLAVYVALGLSAGSCTCLDASSAYAADVTVGVSDNRTSDIIGGSTDGNTVTIGATGGGNHPVISANVVGGTSANPTGNTVTINSARVTGSVGVLGGYTSNGAVTGNKVFLNGGTVGNIYGALSTGGGTATGNELTINNGSAGNVIGGAASAGAGATGNKVFLNGGTISGMVAGGYGANATDATGNTVTITGGTFSRDIYGGYSSTTSTNTSGNIVNIGSGGSNYGANLTGSRIYGGRNTNNVTGNTLNVNASGIVVRTAQNFEKYNFNLTKGVAAGSTMLKVTDSGGFGSTPNVQWSKITMSAEGWNADTTKYGRLGTMELLRTGSGADLKIFNTEALDRKATSGDFEYHMYTDVATPPMFFGYNMVNYVRADIDRFQNADATADNVTGTAVYGGYSSLGNTTTNNKIKITNTNNTNLNVCGGYTAGNGDSTNNHVTITGTGKVGGVYAGRAQSAAGKAERNTITIEPGGWAENPIFGGYAKGGVKGNIVNIKGTVNATVYGGRLLGGGTADANEVHLDGAVVKNQVIGAEGDNGALVKENRASVTNSLVKDDVIGGFSRGTNGKAERNTVLVMGAGAKVTGDVYGARAVDHAAAEENEVTISSGTFEKGVYGAYTNGTGTLTRNVVTISDGTFRGFVSGGYSLTAGLVTGNKIHVSGGTFESVLYAGYADKYGTVTGNVLKITGGVFKNTVYGGAGGDTDAAYTTKTFVANNNTVTIAGGTFAKNIYGAYSWHANGKTENNTVNLGDDTHTDLSGTTLSASNISGGNKAATGNTLNVNAKNIAAKSVNNFENYKFKLNSATAFGDTMLTVTDAGDFAGTGVDWSKLTLDRTALSDVSSLHGIQRITLLKRSNAADTLKFQNYGATENGTATETHEFGLVTDTDTDEANAALFEVSRFKGSEVVYNGTTETYQGASGSEIYGGLSRYGHTTTGNKLTVTGLKGANDPKYAFGGINKGATGDVKNNTLNIEMANAGDTIDEAYAGEAENENNTGEVSGNIANMKTGTVNKIYGGHTFGTGSVKNNTVNFSGGESTDYVAGGYVDNAGNSTEVSGNKVVFTGGTAVAVEGAAGKGTGALKNNTVAFSGTGSAADTLRGAKSEGQGLVEENGVTIAAGTVAHAYGAVTDGTGIATKNYVTVSGGTVNTEIAGGVGYNVTENTVTISGGTVSGDVYGGKTSGGPGSSVSNNTVNLGAEDGTYSANLTNAALHGDNNLGTGATLNVRAKNITAKSADKFANYTFHLNDDIAQNGGSMLTLTENNGFNGGNLFDWTKLDVDTSRLSGNTVIGNATLLTGTTNGLKFSNYAGRNRTTAATNGDYETALRTDTNTGTASKVILDYNRFQNNTNATYDGSTPATTLPDGTTEVYGGISYAGNTTTNNHLTITNLQTDLTFAYGGKTAALAGNTVNNSVTVTGTGSKKIDNINGGYTGKADGVAEKNRVIIKGGTVTNAMGGAVSGANGSATGNEVTVEDGTVANVIGGGGTSTAAGSMSENKVTITGGTVTGYVIGGDSRVLASTSNKNVINLGDDTGTYAANLSGAQLWGTSYNGNVLANDDAKLADNTLNIKAKNGAEVAKVRNVQKFNFLLHDDTTKTAPLLNMTDADGFGKVSADNSDVKVAWANVMADPSGITTATDTATVQGKNTYTLMRGANNALKFSDYVARYDTHGGVYETGLRTDTGTNTATEVLYDVNRFKDGRVTYTAASTGDALGGYSAFGNTTEGNKLTVEGVTGSLAAVYGAQTVGTAGGSVNNTVTLAGTGTGSIANVYGGAVTNAANAGDVTGNTVTITGGTVTGAVYGGHTVGTGKTTGNAVNIGDGSAATLAAGTNLDNAALYGGNKADDVTGNTLNVMVKAAKAQKAQNFENYTFHLTDHIAVDKPSSGTIDDTFTQNTGTMLTLANGFDGQEADWSKVTIDTSRLSADKTLGAITLMKSDTANGLTFRNYAAITRDAGVTSGDYEVVQRTDTTDTGTTVRATTVLIDVNRYKNGDVTYDGVNPNAKTYAGVSYGGNTAKDNTITLTGIASGNTVRYLSGGRSEGTAGGAVNNTVNLVNTGAGTLEEVYGGYIGNAANAADATGNTVNIAGGTAQNVYGGYTNGTGKTTGNIVNVGSYTDRRGNLHAYTAGAAVTGTIYGGNKADDVTGNTLNVRDVITAGQIANFEKLNFAVNRDTAGKTLLTVNGGAATTGLDWAKLTTEITTADLPTKSYGATRVTLMDNANGIDFGTTYDRAKEVVADDVYEFSVDKDNTSVYADGYRFKDNTAATYADSDNAHESAWGGRSELGKTAEGNVLTVTGGTITDTAYGGTSRRGKAQNNRLVMRGGDVQTLKGGFGESASGNTVDVFGGTVRGDVYGGHATAGDAASNTVNLLALVTVGGTIHGGKASAASTNNTIAVHAFGTTAKDIDNVQNLHFYLPAGTTSAETRTMLTLTNAPAVKDISTLNLGVAAVAADARALRPGDAVSLLKTNGTLTTAAQLRNTGNARTMTASHGGILDYTLGLAKRGENELVATVERVDVNSRSKSPVETRAAATAMINMGADFLTNAGMAAATDAASHVISSAAVPATSSGEGMKNTEDGFSAVDASAAVGANAAADVSGAFQPWAAQGGSAMRIHSGSYVDAKGWNLNVGFARTNEAKGAKLTYGPFVEYGRGTYDSYLDDGTHGDGSMHYIGAGVMAKLTQESGTYVEGSLRAGRISRDYAGSGDAAELSYDDASTYFAGHIGVGQEWQLTGGDKIEGYAKYFYSHQAGDTVKLRSGADLEFGAVASHRLRVGARYTHAAGSGSEVFAGLGYEYEFDGDATAMYQGYATPSPSLHGGTALLELGYRFAPKDGRVSYGVNLMGTKGKRDGIAGGVQVNWAF